MAKITVQGKEVTIINFDEKDYISMTDMVKGIENGLALIEKWLRNKNTIEFLGIWEEIYNPNFNSPEFEGIKNEAGLNRFVLSVKQSQTFIKYNLCAQPEQSWLKQFSSPRKHRIIRLLSKAPFPK